MYQMSFIPQPEEDATKEYTNATGTPLYVPRGVKPHVLALADTTKFHALLRSIDASSLPIEEKTFLAMAARRHVRFDYEAIADYYANASPEMQRLMEDSALVIPDFDRAIELGYVRLSDDLRRQYLEEGAESEN